MISTLYWNCRGKANASTVSALTCILKSSSVDLVFLSEPKSSFTSSLSSQFQSLGFAFLDSNTSSSSSHPNLWALWKTSCSWTFSSTSSSPQHLSILASNHPTAPPCSITAVYAATDIRKRRPLWNTLRSLSSTPEPWCVLGDFNAVSLSCEKYGRRPPLATATKEFNDMILDTGIMELKTIGSKFTWANNRTGSSYVAARLDRAFCNQAWSLSYSDYSTSHLPRVSSDHCPLLLAPPIPHKPKNLPFKFEEMWLSHPNFKEAVSSIWAENIYGNPQFVLASKLKALKNYLKQWNRDVFGNLQARISEASANLNQHQISADLDPTIDNLSSLNLAKAHLHNLLKDEETHWKQKARIKWDQDGDRNTRYFHAMAKS